MTGRRRRAQWRLQPGRERGRQPRRLQRERRQAEVRWVVRRPLRCYHHVAHLPSQTMSHGGDCSGGGGVGRHAAFAPVTARHGTVSVRHRHSILKRTYVDTVTFRSIYFRFKNRSELIAHLRLLEYIFVVAIKSYLNRNNSHMPIMVRQPEHRKSVFAWHQGKEGENLDRSSRY